MPKSIFPSVISFSNQQQPEKIDPTSEEDFGVQIARAVDVQELDTNLYMSKELWLPIGARGAFGGQIVAQALHAAFNTVGKTFFCHSLHSYFILPGDVSVPVLYEVTPLRDGRSFATRFVRAKQRGKAIFVLSCSFTKEYTDPSIDHQSIMPKVPAPDSLPSYTDIVRQQLENNNLSAKYRDYLQKRLEEESPIDYREVDPEDIHDENDAWFTTGQKGDRRARWCLTRGKLGDDPRLHALIIAYLSDSGFIMTAALAGGAKRRGVGMMASLDHSIFFHKPARADEWLLYDMQSPRSGDGRGMAFGRIYTKDGMLAVTTVQEGLIRLTKAEQDRVRQEREEKSKL
ncbi:Thioesterase/thiol ester dehydrase-isomerase [Hesseltinella vesiculosa]|uniref:Thioesterase/thiol ester dehydrase-isomerase n=1 Tax=Hesseltinella vesiculosa TaxID=101127 RepID=A0A1X2GBW9_9FUNG|nr:Thioesterase/thiol ester dehydrase-isomerase [Hesseltinella vesiculosa]